jgi:hypothetical protein
MNRPLVVIGALLLIAGFAWSWLSRLNLFRLPGDIVIERPHWQFYFPITTLILISAVLSLIAWLMRH